MSIYTYGHTVVYVDSRGTKIIVEPGQKSKHDFRVKYQEKGKRERTPKHIHIIIDLYMKLIGNDSLTMQLVDYLITDVIDVVQPSTKYPPTLQVFQSPSAQKFRPLDTYGEYPVDFLMVVTELIQIQEKTNYPTGTFNRKLFESFRKRNDIFVVVSHATFR